MEYQEITNLCVQCVLAGFVIGFIPLLIGLAVNGALKIFKQA